MLGLLAHTYHARKCVGKRGAKLGCILCDRLWPPKSKQEARLACKQVLLKVKQRNIGLVNHGRVRLALHIQQVACIIADAEWPVLEAGRGIVVVESQVEAGFQLLIPGRRAGVGQEMRLLLLLLLSEVSMALCDSNVGCDVVLA